MDEKWIWYHIRKDMISSSRVCYHKFISTSGWQVSTGMMVKHRTTVFYKGTATISSHTHIFLFHCTLLSNYLEICFSQNGAEEVDHSFKDEKKQFFTILHLPVLWIMIYISTLFLNRSQRNQVRRFSQICQLHIASYYSVQTFSFPFLLCSYFLWNNSLQSSLTAWKFPFSVFSLYFCLKFYMPASNLWAKKLRA